MADKINNSNQATNTSPNQQTVPTQTQTNQPTVTDRDQPVPTNQRQRNTTIKPQYPPADNTNPSARVNETQTPEQPQTEQSATVGISTSKTVSNQKVNSIIFLVLGFIETLMVLRLVFRLLKANPHNGFINFIYSLTLPLISPFQGIFNTSAIDEIVEISLLIALVVYALIAVGISKIFNAIQS